MTKAKLSFLTHNIREQLIKSCGIDRRNLRYIPYKQPVNIYARVLAPTPDSQDDALLKPISTSGEEQAAESADGDEDDGAESEGQGGLG